MLRHPKGREAVRRKFECHGAFSLTRLPRVPYTLHHFSADVRELCEKFLGSQIVQVRQRGEKVDSTGQTLPLHIMD
ncbi:hypothetical protein E2C01_034451 [Portunus trituberculatus]|uniref:Uncharacterized protein n=1 Tax=Portunus trituberculatus TaxID=210409 RepID=A0A5B7F5U5_PORTR|nr:hypothetical protein [Portunus trituberculatus]